MRGVSVGTQIRIYREHSRNVILLVDVFIQARQARASRPGRSLGGRVEVPRYIGAMAWPRVGLREGLGCGNMACDCVCFAGYSYGIV